MRKTPQTSAPNFSKTSYGVRPAHEPTGPPASLNSRPSREVLRSQGSSSGKHGTSGPLPQASPPTAAIAIAEQDHVSSPPAQSPIQSQGPLSADNPRLSPKTRLRALLADGPASKMTDTPISTTSSDSRTASPSRAKAQSLTRRSSSPTIGTAAMDAALSDPSKPSLTTVPKTNLFNGAEPRPSIDSVTSAQSSTSAQTQAVLASHDFALPPSVDAATLIDQAGSPEAAIEKLIEERKAIMARNETLWKVVDRQRTMMQTHTKALDRLKADNEKLKKRLKDQLFAIPPTPTIASQAAAQKQGPMSPRLPEEMGKHASRSGNTSIDSTASGSLGATVAAAREATIEDATRRQATKAIPKEINTSHDVPRTAEGEKILQTIKTPLSAASVVSMSSPGRGGRKAPPLALDLSQSQIPATNLRLQRSQSRSGSEYEEETDDEPVHELDRGRRRTREADDRHREFVAQAEETRSRSEKQKKSSSKSKTSGEYAPEMSEKKHAAVPEPSAMPSVPAVGLPMSPRAAILGGLQSPMPQQVSVGAIASTLKPAERPFAQRQGQAVPMPFKSPGLPMSPRPSNNPGTVATPRLPKESIMSPGPFSPKPGMGMVGLPMSPRAPRQPIPVPPQSALALQSPHVVRAQNYGQTSLGQSALRNHTRAKNSIDSMKDAPDSAIADELSCGEIYQGLKSDQYPNWLLSPNALPLIQIKVDSSRFRPKRSSWMAPGNEDESIFTLAVHLRADNSQLWRVEKGVLSIPMLDRSIRHQLPLAPPLPDRDLFSGHAPPKIDARRKAINEYFESLLDLPMSDSVAGVICQFFSEDAVGPLANAAQPDSIPHSPTIPGVKPRMAGYLAKRGKQFGGWKARFFVLDGQELRYFESPGGAHLRTIKLANAQIAKQNNKDSNEDTDYRHAFLILEPKRKDSSGLVRHVLCAESDQERDQWVEALMSYVDIYEGDGYSPTIQSAKSDVFPHRSASFTGQKDVSSTKFQAISYESTAASLAPNSADGRRPSITPSPASDQSSDTSVPPSRRDISAPVAGGPIQNLREWGNKMPSSPLPKDREPKKRHLFGFKGRSSEESVPTVQRDLHPASNGHSASDVSPSRAVFGITLADAAQFHPPRDVDILLPAPVYRCIEYLEARKASNEEGIFRLSGSSTVIRALKERFNTEGDVRLCEGEQYDIHAVSSLLKLYLRELPETVLTRALHLDFLKVLETESKKERNMALNVLVHKLPPANYELLATLSRFLNDVVNNERVNLMSIRNVGIVFSPTLNIPAPLISSFLTEYDKIFGDTVDAADSPVLQNLQNPPQISINQPMGMDALRSPRKQVFGENLATPAPTQTEFSAQARANPFMDPRALAASQHQQAQHQDASDVGFVPVRHPGHTKQAYYTAVQAPPSNPSSDGGFGSLNALLGASNAGPSISAVLGNSPQSLRSKGSSSRLREVTNASGSSEKSGVEGSPRLGT